MVMIKSNYRLPFLLLILSVIQVVGIAAESEGGSNTSAAVNRDWGNADILYVKAVAERSGNWTFVVTVSHPDKGWDDYADGWDIVLPDATVIKADESSPFTRLLLHPHVGEQPFTRSQSALSIPSDITLVKVRAHDLADGFGGREVTVDLNKSRGDDFEVIRKK